MILSVTHPDIDPTVVVRTGELPAWLDEIKAMVDLSSTIDVGALHLRLDEAHSRPVTRSLLQHFPECKILRVIRRGDAA